MFLIDGNNVMGQRVGWHKDKPAAQRRLLHDVARLARLKKTRMTVVFDGAPNANFLEGSGLRGVRIFYARPGSDADSRIVETVEAERNRKNLTVVTSDNSLAARVRVCGVRVMRAGEFRRMLDETPASADSDQEPSVRADELSGWLRYFGVDEDE
jgi:predicted RNA-binding protein with PIN domain